MGSHRQVSTAVAPRRHRYDGARSGGRHRDPLQAGPTRPRPRVEVRRAPDVPRHRSPVGAPVAGTGIHRARPPLPGGLRRYAADPRFGLVVALIAALILVTGKAHTELTRERPLAATGAITDGQRADDSRGGPASRKDAEKRAPGASAERQQAGRPTPTARPKTPAPAGAAAPTAGIGAAPGSTPTATPTASTTPTPQSSTGPAGAIRRTELNAVALTFDDGPDPITTPMLLTLLRQHDVQATFCLVGARARAFPELVRRIAADNHTLCNHSWDHDFELGKRPVDEIRADLERTNEAIRAAVPQARIGYFRAPGGFFTPSLVEAARGYGMASIYWDVDPQDWKHTLGETPQEHVDRVVSVLQQETTNGSIVLAHDFNQPLTIAAFTVLMPWLKDRFDLVALPR